MTVPALTFRPGSPGSARLEDIDLPGPETGALTDIEAVGVCGTDRELLAGRHGSASTRRSRMVLGHEAVGRIVDAPPDCDLDKDDLVVPMVRLPDPVPCANCAGGEWDMCSNGRYTEHGIKGVDGFMAGQVRIDPDHTVKVPEALGDVAVLTEPASVVAKAWEHIERIGDRGIWDPQTVLVTGAGPIGLLAAMMASQRGLDVRVFDRVTTGPKPDLVEDLGASYRVDDLREASTGADVVVECTGAAPLVFDVLDATGRNGIVCLTGVTSPDRTLQVPAGAISREIVLENDVVFGTVNANRRHYEKAIESLGLADTDWLSRLVSRRLPLEAWETAFEREDDDVKVVIEPPEGDTSR